MRNIFYGYISLNKLDIKNFNNNNAIDDNLIGMFSKCPNNLIAQFKEDNKYGEKTFQCCIF